MTSEGRIGSVPEPDRDSQLGYRIAASLSNRSAPSSFPHHLDLAGVLRIVSGTRRSLQLREPLALTTRTALEVKVARQPARRVGWEVCDACNEAFRVCHGHPGSDDRNRGQQEAESHPIAPDLSHLLTNC